MGDVVTLTLNPAIDETVMLDRLVPGTVQRARSVAFHAGGKGVNVASCLADWGGVAVTAAGILGRGNEAPFEELFAARSIADAFIRVPGETRTNIKIVHDGETTDINLPGLVISPAEARAVFERTVALGGPDRIVLLAGSLPAGIDDAVYAELTAALAARGARVMLDTSGAPLDRALAAKRLPFCIKPNRAELEAFVGGRLPGDSALVRVARDLIARGVSLVVVSLGAEGALFVTATDVVHASLPPMHVASTVGAGDAMVAGIIAAIHDDAGLEATARLATAFAAAKLGRAGASLPPRSEVQSLSAGVNLRKEGVNAP